MKERNLSIDFLKFVFTLIIVAFHSIYSLKNINSYYLNLWNCVREAYIIVDFFFVISGYFLWKKIFNSPDLTIECFLKKRFFRLWPNLALSIVLFIISTMFFVDINFRISYEEVIPNLLLIPIPNFYHIVPINIASWYVYVLLWLSVFYFSLSKILSQQVFLFITSLLVFFSLSIVLSYPNAQLGMWDKNYLHLFNGGFLRGIYGLGLGIIIGYCTSKSVVTVTTSNKIHFFYSIFEIILFSMLIYYMLFSEVKLHYNFNYLFMFIGLFFCLIYQRGILSNFINRLTFLNKVYSYSYSIYVMQIFSFQFFPKIFSQLDVVGINYLLFSIVAILILGIVGQEFINLILRKYYENC